MISKIEELQKMIDESNNIVAFTGAGISTESGIKDFRSQDGLYNINNSKYKFPPEYMLSSSCLYNHPKDFFKYYKEQLNCLGIKPNITHNYLKKLEDIGKLKAIVTQNIDGLHTKAGNTNIYELHGTIYKNYCTGCYKEYPADYIFNSKDIPICNKCGKTIRPNVVLYGEMLPEQVYKEALLKMSEADMLIVIGTSLTVYPACDMINVFKGKYLVIINNDKTQYDNKANLVINDKLKNVFEKLK